MTSAREVQRLDFTTDAGQGPRALLGLIVLETDRTVEAEFRALYRDGGLDGVAHHASRIPMEATVTAETLAAMEERLPVAAGLLPPAFGFDAIGYACTSGATLIGEERVAELVGAHHPGVPCTNPLTAAVAAFRAVDAGTIALITPYNADVTRRMAALYEERGIAVTSIASFLEEDDDLVGRIDEASVAEAVRTVAGESDADAVFVSCTSLRAFGVIDDLEAEVGRPVVSSNQALSWHLLRLAGLEGELPGPGRLFRHGLPS